MIKEAQEHQQEARYNLNRSTEKFILNLTNSAFCEIDQFKSDLREKMYAHINKNIEDEECKEIFKNELIQGIETLHEDIKWRFRECEKRFDGEIKEAIKQLEYRIKDSLAMLECISIDRGFNLNFDTDSGIDGTKLATSIGGLGLLGIFNAWNPMGWLALTAGIITGLVGIARSMRSFFSSRYKRSQQKKEVDKNLHQICEKIVQDVKSRLESRKKDIWEKIGKLKANLRPVDNYERMKRQLKEAHEKLGYISHNIKTKEHAMKNETLEQFKKDQKRNQEILKKLLDFVHTGEKYGIKVEESLKDKIRNAMENVAGQKLKVALVGGFSEGKTSIAAAWIERLDKSMKINHQESSDEVKIYDIDNEIELVDTPGLFGFKEKITDSGKIERYKDITKKYVSEAHLILYALNPSNPIKESHKDDLNWLFRTLNLLSRTIFVISRFDEEADIEDEEDYNKRFKIKKENIQNRLNDLISLSEEEKESLIIVAVAANPFDLGVEHWLKHKEEFQKLSHIKALQDATQKKIKENGGKLTIIEETKKASFKMWSIGKCRPQNKRCKILIEKWNI